METFRVHRTLCICMPLLQDKNEAEMINKQARRRLEDFRVPDVS